MSNKFVEIATDSFGETSTGPIFGLDVEPASVDDPTVAEDAELTAEELVS